MIRRKGKWVITALLITILFIMIFPMLYMIALSFQNPGAFSVSFKNLNLTFQNYTTVFEANNFGRYFFNSSFVAIAVTAGNMLLCAMAGYGLSRGRKKITCKRNPCCMLRAACCLLLGALIVPSCILPVIRHRKGVGKTVLLQSFGSRLSLVEARVLSHPNPVKSLVALVEYPNCSIAILAAQRST